jgi:hypothetical protein
MATVNDKMTALANAIRTKSGATGKLSLDGMISAVNGISTGGSSTQTYTLWGSHTVMPNDFEAGNLAGTYTIPANSMYSLFYSYDETRWVYTEVTQIEVFSNGNIDVYGYNGVFKYYACDEGIWYDEEDRTDDRLRFYNIPNPTTVSKNLYDLFYKMYDNGEAYMNAYDIGYKIGSSSSSGLPSLGAFFDWSVMVDSGSEPVLSISNYHSIYTMYCEIDYGGWTAEVEIPCDDSSSWNLNILMFDIYGDDYNPMGISSAGYIDVYNIRWDY